MVQKLHLLVSNNSCAMHLVALENFHYKNHSTDPYFHFRIQNKQKITKKKKKKKQKKKNPQQKKQTNKQKQNKKVSQFFFFESSCNLRCRDNYV